MAELLLICSFIFFFISWGVGSAIWVPIIQVFPSGSEVQHLHYPVWLELDVARFQIAMGDSLRRSMEAELAARRAVQLAPRSIAAHYMLGLALLQQNRATRETAEQLEIAFRKYPDVGPGLAWVRKRLASASPRPGK